MFSLIMWKSFFLIGLFGQMILGQENAQTRIPASLEECYQNADIFERDNRLPMTINTLIELIRKIENSQTISQDMKQLAVSLLHRFKLDGIERAPGVINTRKVIPFSPSGYQFSKHRLLLSRLIPGNALGFDNETLSVVERCNLHFMLSNSIEAQVRGDEAYRCNQLAQLRVNRIPRSAETFLRNTRSVPIKNNFLGDVELLDEVAEHKRRQRKFKQSGNYQMTESDGDDDDDDDNDERIDEAPEENDEDLPEPSARGSDASLVEVSTNLLSQCPVQNGVVRTTWGSLSIGSVIAGIAAGLEQQTITTRELLTLSRPRGDQYKAKQSQGLMVDNRWAATLAGDLAEVALLQAPGAAQVSVGATGGWNQTTIPKWYFLTKRERLEMTDPEIRGGLDGLILAKNVAEYRNRVPGLKLSQLLDMYYSRRGVFSSNVKACERRTHFTSVAGVEEMTAQTTAFSLVLDREMQLKVTLRSEAITQFSGDATQALSTYVPSSLDDLSCEATALIPNDPTIWRASTDIYIYVDASWQFNEIQPSLFYLLENLDVNPYESSYTILNARTGAIIVNTTSYILDFNARFNRTEYQNQVTGMDLTLIFKNILSISKNILDNERRSASTGGRSHVALIVPQMAGLNEGESNVAWDNLQILRELVPDLAVLFLTGGTQTRFERFVKQPHRDLFSLRVSSSPNDNIPSSLNSVIQRIQQVPRRIINPRCGSNWLADDLGSNKMNQFVERGGVNFYRVSPNYFFINGKNRKIRIEGKRNGVISVCSSRNVENPRFNMSGENDISCVKIDGDSYDYYLPESACDGTWLIQYCAPIFISVEGPPIGGEETNFRCSDEMCRFPDSIYYVVHAENLGCASGVGRILGAIYLVLASVFIAMKI